GRRRAGTFLDTAVRGEIRHREALGASLRPEVEARLPFDDERDARERRKRSGLHDRSAVRPDRDADGRGRAERGAPAPRRDEDALAADIAGRGADTDDAVTLAQEARGLDLFHEARAGEPCRRAQSRERGE